MAEEVAFSIEIGSIVHIMEEGTEGLICNAGIIGGTVSVFHWIEMFRFGTYTKQVWLQDVNWHPQKYCPNKPTAS